MKQHIYSKKLIYVFIILQLYNSDGGYIMKLIVLALVILALVPAAAASRISIGAVTNEDIFTRVSITNNHDYDIDSARIRLYLPELDIISPSLRVNLDDNERTIKNMIFLDDVPSGEHLVRISVKKGNDRKVAYRYVIFD